MGLVDPEEGHLGLTDPRELQMGLTDPLPHSILGYRPKKYIIPVFKYRIHTFPGTSASYFSINNGFLQRVSPSLSTFSRTSLLTLSHAWNLPDSSSGTTSRYVLSSEVSAWIFFCKNYVFRSNITTRTKKNTID
jgi:hypothetical protein